MANDQITDQTMLSQRWPGAGLRISLLPGYCAKPSGGRLATVRTQQSVRFNYSAFP